MNLYEAFETDKECVTDGVWLDVHAAGKRVGRIRCRPADADLNEEYRKALLDLARDVRKKLSNDDLNSEDDHELLATVYATTVVTDWDFTGRDGKKLACKKANIVKVFTDMPKLFTVVKRMCTQWTNFRKQFEEAAVKNS